MTAVKPPTGDDLAPMADLAARCQHDPTRHCAYVSMDPEPIAHEIASAPDWMTHTRVVRDGDDMAGWLLAEVEPEIGRVWWWGPFVAGDRAFGPTADRLYETIRADLDSSFAEEEMAFDDRHDGVSGFAGRHGFRADVASSVLSCHRPIDADRSSVRHLKTEDHCEVIRIHDAAFPGAHIPGKMLVRPRPAASVLVSTNGPHVTGYVAYERASDGDGYIDFLAVHPERRREGIGARLVAAAVHQLQADGIPKVHLTVREDNQAARSLYHRLGFSEERLIRPYRIGFTVG